MRAPVVFRIGVVLSPRSWSGQLHGFIADHVPDVDLIVVRDQRAAIEADTHVLLIDDSTPWLTQPFVEEATRRDVRLVGIYDRADGGAGRARLAGLGLTHLIEETMPPDDVVFLLDRLRPIDGADLRSLAPVERDHGQSSTRGSLVAVGGPSGSGAREVAIGLASAWSAQGWATLLVDVNETTPGVARRLGLGVYPHLLTAVDRLLVDGPGGVRAALADRVGDLTFDVIVGLPTPRDWDRLVSNDLDRLLEACRDEWDRVVLTTSPLIEDLLRWGDRFGISRRVIGSADAMVGCCEPSPRGVLRYMDWISETSRLRSNVLSVMNKVPKSRRVAAETGRQLRDVGGALIDDVLEVPLDRSVASAEWDGVVVTRGAFRRSLDAVALEAERQLTEAAARVVS